MYKKLALSVVFLLLFGCKATNSGRAAFQENVAGVQPDYHQISNNNFYDGARTNNVKKFGMTSQPHVIDAGYRDYAAPYMDYTKRVIQAHQILQQQQRVEYYNQQRYRFVPSYSTPRRNYEQAPIVRQLPAPAPSVSAPVEEAPDKL